MSPIEKYDKAFIDAFEVTTAQLNAGLAYQSVPTWDSVGHMSLIAELEDAFDIMMETDDIITFSDYEKGKLLLAKYDVVL